MKEQNNHIIVIALIGLLLVALIAFPGSDFFQKLNQNANLLLVFLTGAYVILTYLILNSQRKLSSEQSRPFVYASLPTDGIEVVLSIKNIGNRPAYNVKVTFEPKLTMLSTRSVFQGMSEPLLEQSFMPPDFEIRNPVSTTIDVLELDKQNQVFQVKLRYEDSEAHEYSDQYSINLGSYVFDRKVMDYTIEHHVESISKTLKEISEQLKKFW
jgi:hypothetical protein